MTFCIIILQRMFLHVFHIKFYKYLNDHIDHEKKVTNYKIQFRNTKIFLDTVKVPNLEH